MKRAKCLIFVFCSCLQFTYGQTADAPLQLLAKAKGLAVHLRWTTADLSVWKSGMADGYTVSRQMIERDGKKVTGKAQTLAVLKPISREQWYTLAEKVEYARVITGYLYEEPITDTDTAVVSNALRGRQAFMSLVADFSPEVARGLALGYVDTTVKPNEQYIYQVQLTKDTKIQARIAAGLELAMPTFPPRNLQVADFADSVCTLSWEIHNRSVYAAYRIERSQDEGVSFQPVSELPYLPVNNAPDAEKILYSNKVPVLHREYWYRVKGIDPFSDEGDPSNAVKLYAYRTKLPEPEGLAYLFQGDLVHVSWNFPDSLRNNLRGFNVYLKKGNAKSEEPVLQNRKVLTTIKPYNFIFKTRPEEQNYIVRVTAVDLRNKETYSAPLLVILSDSTEPTAPINLMGSVDTNGIAEICWSRSKELDVYSYELKRAWGDSTSGSFFLVKDIPWKDSVYVDTISMNMSKVYSTVHYLLTAVDHHVNISEVSDTLVLPIPDIHPPSPANIMWIGYTDTTVYVRMGKSSSKDVIRYRLSKFYPPDTANTKLLLDFSVQNMVDYYEDPDFEESRRVVYVLETVDGAYHVAKESLGFTVPEYVMPEVKLNLKYDKKANTVLVDWKDYKFPQDRKIVRFEIYRMGGGIGHSEFVGATVGGEQSWVDENVKVDQQYYYYVIAYDSKGKESSRPLTYYPIKTDK